MLGLWQDCQVAVCDFPEVKASHPQWPTYEVKVYFDQFNGTVFSSHMDTF